MKTKIDYMHMLTDLPVSDLQEMFEDELWDEQIRQDFLAGKFAQIIAGTEKVRTREEWSVVLKEVGIDFD